jgi:hypothetical protein
VACPSLVVFDRSSWRRSCDRFWFMISHSRFSPPAQNIFCARSTQPGPCLATSESDSIYSPPTAVCATEAVPLMNSVDLFSVPDLAGAASFNFCRQNFLLPLKGLSSACQSMPPIFVLRGTGTRSIHSRVLSPSPTTIGDCCRSSNFWFGFSVRNKIRIRLLFSVMGRLVL